MRWKLPTYSNREKEEIISDRIHDKADREMFVLKLIDGLSLNSIAEKQNRAYSTVRDHYYKGIKTIFEDFPGR